MARYRGTTEQRGVGHAHRADKKRLKALLRDGEPCWRCGQPMYKWQELDRDHIVDRALGGAQGPAVLAHASCNRSAGAKLGNQLRPYLTKAAAGRDTICRACGKPYSRAPRTCEICGAHYHPNHGEQRTCGRSCGVELKRRKKMANGWIPPVPAICACGRRMTKGSQRCRDCLTAMQREIARSRPAPEPYAPRSMVAYYTCRYCGKLGVTTARGQTREVCTSRACQLARLQANNLIARNGVAREDADAFMARIVQGITRQARQW